MPIVHWHDFAGRDREKTFLLDVRTSAEYAAGTIEDAVNIPVDSLRHQIDRIPHDREIWVLCQVGLRGHVATRVLLQRGYRARNLTGGYKTWKTATSSAPE
jgi:rhodanese-related sulfurtransferase